MRIALNAPIVFVAVVIVVIVNVVIVIGKQSIYASVTVKRLRYVVVIEKVCAKMGEKSQEKKPTRSTRVVEWEGQQGRGGRMTVTINICTITNISECGFGLCFWPRFLEHSQ